MESTASNHRLIIEDTRASLNSVHCADVELPDILFEVADDGLVHVMDVYGAAGKSPGMAPGCDAHTHAHHDCSVLAMFQRFADVIGILHPGRRSSINAQPLCPQAGAPEGGREGRGGAPAQLSEQ